MQLREKRVLVTGAGGFIGSHLTEHLVDIGANVKAFVRYNSRNDWGLLELLPKEKLNKIEVVFGENFKEKLESGAYNRIYCNEQVTAYLYTHMLKQE